MKTLLQCLAIAVCFSLITVSCKKKSEDQPTTTSIIHVTISNLPANTVYTLKADQTRPVVKSFVDVTNGNTNKTYDFEIVSKSGVSFFWQFILDGNKQGQGTITIKNNDELIHTTSGHGGSYVFTTP